MDTFLPMDTACLMTASACMYICIYICIYIYIYIMTASAQVTEQGGAFTLANYADGYEMWLSVQPK